MIPAHHWFVADICWSSNMQAIGAHHRMDGATRSIGSDEIEVAGKDCRHGRLQKYAVSALNGLCSQGRARRPWRGSFDLAQTRVTRSDYQTPWLLMVSATQDPP